MTLEEMNGSLKEYDYSACNRILNENDHHVWEGYNISSLGNVLLVGATSFLGIHLFCELLRGEERKIYCLLKPNEKFSSLKKQLKTSLMFYFGETFDKAIGTRIIPVNGDFTDATSLGTVGDYPINTVLNCAYEVEPGSTDEQLEAVNYQGVVNLLTICRDKAWRLIHISTMNVAGVRMKNDKNCPLFTEKEIYAGQVFTSQEACTRFRAERLLLEEAAKGMKVKIMRIGQLTGRQVDGEFQMEITKSNLVTELKQYVTTGLCPLGSMTDLVEMSPVDCAASAIIRLARTPDNMVVFHPYSNFTVNKGTLITALIKSGYPIKIVSDKDFAEACLSGGTHSPFLPLERNNTFTTSMLYRLGFNWPLPTEIYVKRFIQLLDGMGVF